MRQNLKKSKNVTKLKNLGCDKTHQLKLGQSSETKIVIKLKKFKWSQNSKTLIVIKLRHSNCNQAQQPKSIKKKSSNMFFGNNNLTP